MALEDLARLVDDKAFTSVRRFEDLSLYHVDFDSLAGREDTETALQRAASARRSAAVVGVVGSGKSSVMASVLGPLAEDLDDRLVPIRVLVGSSGDDVARDVKRLAQEVITMVTRTVTPMDDRDRDRFRVESSDRELRPGRATTKSGSFGFDKIIKLGAGRDVQSFAETLDRERTGGEMVVVARELFDTLRAHEIEPMLILDDTDTWLNLPGNDKRQLADVFFAEVLRAFVREVDCPVFVAVHPHYGDLDGYRRARQEILELEVDIPRLPDAPVAVAKIIARALEVHQIATPVDELFEREAIDGLGWHYVERPALRNVVLVLGRAIYDARERRAEVVTAANVEEAIRYWQANLE